MVVGVYTSLTGHDVGISVLCYVAGQVAGNGCRGMTGLNALQGMKKQSKYVLK